MSDTWPTERQDHPLAHLIREITGQDRCDSCGAQAYLAALIGPTDEHPLYFCAHHGAQHLAALQASATAIRDERYKINVTPSTSASV